MLCDHNPTLKTDGQTTFCSNIAP